MLFKLVYQGTLGAQGLPLGVQVVGKPWNEELVLHVMKLLESNRKMYFP
jgi:Asp-tRNA(Asn)/Glu-tRNA(Gln) amidotransferase A subunit family amidase